MQRQQWDRRYADKELLWSSEPNCFVRAEIGELTPGTALDVASGEGRNAIWLAEQGWRVTAVDFSTVAMDRARRRAERAGVDVQWVLEDVTRYHPPRAHFSLVLLCYLQLPATERGEVLARARDAVAPGGTLLYIGHDLSNLERGHGGPRDASVLCTPEDVVAELSGFHIVKAEVARREVQTTGEAGDTAHAAALDTLVRAERR